MKKPLRLSTKHLLAMYRCALYTAMGVRNDEQKPTDRQVLAWLQVVFAQAQHQFDPPLAMIAHPPQPVKSNSLIPEITILRWDARVSLPDWRNLPA